MLIVDRVEFDQDCPFGPFVWDGRKWRTERRADVATHVGAHSRSTDTWYRLHPYGFDTRTGMWRSLSGGTPAPSCVMQALADHRPQTPRTAPDRPDRAESEACQAGTVGCLIDHRNGEDESRQTW